MHMSRRSNNRGRRPPELGLSGFVEIANALFLEQTAQHLSNGPDKKERTKTQ